MKFTYIITLSIFFLSCSNKKESIENNQTAVDNDEYVLVSKDQFNANKMTLASPSITSFYRTIKANGKVAVPPGYIAAVGAYYAGYVKDINFIEGEYVIKGQKLFSLQNPEYVEIQQDFLATKAELSYLESEYNRQNMLSKESIASQKKYLKAKSEYHVAHAGYNALKKKLNLLGIDVSSLTSDNIRSTVSVYAPISGYLSDVNIIQGKVLSPNETALTVINTDHLFAEIMVFEQDILKVGKSQKVLYEFSGSNKKLEGEVHLVGKSFKKGKNAIQVHGKIYKNENLKDILPGMYLEAEIVTELTKELGIPEASVIEVDGKYYVLKLVNELEKEYKFIQKQVKVLSSSNGFIHVADLGADIFVLHNGAFDLIIE